MRKKFLIGCSLLALFVLFLVGGAWLWWWRGTTAQAKTPPPSLSLLQPVNNATFAFGEPLSIQVRAEASPGRTLRGLVIQANQPVIYRTAAPGQPSLLVQTQWTPTRAGWHTITVTAYDDAGQVASAWVRVQVLPLEGDVDGDGLPLDIDLCPAVPGTLDGGGCPPILSMESDTDGDGVPDIEDWCPDSPGVREASGCLPPETPDTDGDGVPDPLDFCPDLPGSLRDSPLPGGRGNGCPDRDGDRVADPLDACPDTPGVAWEDAERLGCPEPRRGDGRPAPGTPEGGEEEGESVAPPPDRDGDGIPDEEDACPDTPGIGGPYSGCLPPGPDSDRDGDGIPDIWDMCPDDPSSIWWPESDRGCPPPPPDRVCPPPAGSPDARWDIDNDTQPDPCDPDDDDDGWEDFVDLCPFIPGVGVAGASGCHPWLPGEEDADGDGVANRADRCPLHPGPSNAFNRGCPDDMDTAADDDGDGVPNRIDLCPGYVGEAVFLGCSEAGPDPDGDGLTWREDECPEEDGLGMPNGCPMEIEVIDLIGVPISPEDFRIPMPGERENRLVMEIFALETAEPLDRVVCLGQWEGWRGLRYEASPFRFVVEGTPGAPDVVPRLVYRGDFPDDVVLRVFLDCIGFNGWMSFGFLGSARNIFFDRGHLDAFERGILPKNEWIYTSLSNDNFTARIRWCYGTECPEDAGTALPVPEPLPDSLYLSAELISIEVINDGDPGGNGEFGFVELTLFNETRIQRLSDSGAECVHFPGRDFDRVRCDYFVGTERGFDIDDGRTYSLNDNQRSAASPLLMEPGDLLTVYIYAREDDGFLERDEFADYIRYNIPADEWRSWIDVPQTVELEPRPGDDFRIRVTFVLRAAPVGGP